MLFTGPLGRYGWITEVQWAMELLCLAKTVWQAEKLLRKFVPAVLRPNSRSHGIMWYVKITHDRLEQTEFKCFCTHRTSVSKGCSRWFHRDHKSHCTQLYSITLLHLAQLSDRCLRGWKQSRFTQEAQNLEYISILKPWTLLTELWVLLFPP